MYNYDSHVHNYPGRDERIDTIANNPDTRYLYILSKLYQFIFSTNIEEYMYVAKAQ